MLLAYISWEGLSEELQWIQWKSYIFQIFNPFPRNQREVPSCKSVGKGVCEWSAWAWVWDVEKKVKKEKKKFWEERMHKSLSNEATTGEEERLFFLLLLFYFWKYSNLNTHMSKDGRQRPGRRDLSLLYNSFPCQLQTQTPKLKKRERVWFLFPCKKPAHR